MIAVISFSKREFDDFVKPWVSHEDLNKFKFVRRPDDIRGINFTSVVRIGSYFKITGVDELYTMALSRIK